MTGVMAAELAAAIAGPWCDIQGHLRFLADAAASFTAPVTGIELGVRTGQSTRALLAGIEQAGGGTLWSADTDPPQVPAAWHDLDSWRFLQAPDLSPEALAWMPPACDILFIDTGHGYLDTLAELRAYGPRVRPGGIIACHDTQWVPGDTDLGAPRGPVALALDAWVLETARSWTNRPGWYGLGVIRA